MRLFQPEVFQGDIRKNRYFEAPVQGGMTRRIKESVDSEVSLQLCDKTGKILLEDTGRRAGLEIIDKILEYLK